jgi:hypothetical protein
MMEKIAEEMSHRRSPYTRNPSAEWRFYYLCYLYM